MVHGFELFIADQAAHAISGQPTRKRQEPASTRRAASSAADPNSIVNRTANRADRLCARRGGRGTRGYPILHEATNLRSLRRRQADGGAPISRQVHPLKPRAASCPSPRCRQATKWAPGTAAYSIKIALVIARSMTNGAVIRSCRRAATKVRW